MDAERFDSLARIIGGERTRRVLLAAIAGFVPTAVWEGTAWARKASKQAHKKGGGKKGGGKKGGKKKGCPPCKKRKQGKCTGKLPNGAACPGGTCNGGRCVPFTGACAGTGGNAVSVSASGTYAGQPLQATQTLQPFGAQGQTSSKLDFTLGGAPVLTVETSGDDGVAITTLTYGGAFSGIRRAQITNDGTTISGTIDGRAIVPMPASANPNSATFQDGGPPPNVQVDPKLQAAIQGLWQEVGESAASCKAASGGQAASQRAGQASSRRNAKSASQRTKNGHAENGHIEAHPEQDADCLALYIPCQTGYVGCLAGAAGCAALLFGAPICVAAVVVTCTYAAGVCRRGIRLGPTCCPVRCGGNLDAANPFGEDPGCCEKNETCLDPNSSTSACCPPGTSSCGGVCCSNGRCANGSCCEFPNFMCGGTCVGPFTPCCGGAVCNGTCIGNTCCTGGFNCGGFCCQNGRSCCGGVCCGVGQVCNAQNQCTTQCPVMCPIGGNQTCCSAGDCCSGPACDPFCLH